MSQLSLQTVKKKIFLTNEVKFLYATQIKEGKKYKDLLEDFQSRYGRKMPYLGLKSVVVYNFSIFKFQLVLTDFCRKNIKC